MGKKAFTFKQYHENISGQIVKLKITKYTNAIEIVLKNTKTTSVNIKSLALLLIVFINAVAFYYGLVSTNYILVVLLCVVFLLYKMFHVVKCESLLLVKDLGCQINVNRIAGSSFQFIPYNIIDGIFINEVISKHRVLFVLSLKLKEPKNSYLISLFTATKPRVKCIEVIYQNIENFI